MRATHVHEWIHQNLDRFKASHASLETLRRACDTALVELKENVHLCKAQCSSCNLLCLQSRGHDTQHDCRTSHHCPHLCGFDDEHPSEEKKCGFRCVVFCTNFGFINPFTVLAIRGDMCMLRIFCVMSLCLCTYILKLCRRYSLVWRTLQTRQQEGVSGWMHQGLNAPLYPPLAPNNSLLAFQPHGR